MNKDLMELYKEWRTIIEEHNKAEMEIGGSIPILGSWDCGEGYVREDFSDFAKLDKEITFEEMLELEREFEK